MIVQLSNGIKMARLIEEQIIAETDTSLTIRFTKRDGKFLDKEVQKVEGLTNEALLNHWHHRTTIQVLQNRIKPSAWTAPAD